MGRKSPARCCTQVLKLSLVGGFNTYRVNDINVDLPAKVTWTVEFSGVTGTTRDSGNCAALILAGNEAVGGSLDDFWMKVGSDWKLYQVTTGSFAGATLDRQFCGECDRV